ELSRTPMRNRSVWEGGTRFFDDVVDVQWDHLRVALFREVANPANPRAGAMRVRYDFPDTGGRLFDIRSLTAQPPQAAFCISHNGGERLVHLMRDRRAHLTERAHARDVGEGSLSDLQCFLRLPRCRDIHQRTDELLLARFANLTMRSNVNMFDVSIGHQQTVLIVVVRRASYRAIELLLHELAIIGMNALQEQADGRLDRFIESHDPISFCRPEDLFSADSPAEAPRVTEPLGVGQVRLATLQRPLGALLVLDVGAHAIPSDHLSVLVAKRHAAHQMPPIFAVGSPQALFHLE